LGGFDA
jgi:hypothetical protein